MQNGMQAGRPGAAFVWNEAAFLVASEATLPLLLWLWLRRRTVILLETRAILPPLQPILERLAAWLAHKRRLIKVEAAFPDLAVQIGAYYQNRNGAYVDYEPRLWTEFGFETFETAVEADYVRPIKHEISKFAFDFNALIYKLWFLGKACPDGGFTVAGLPRITEDLYRVIFGQGRFKAIWPSPGIAWLNPLLAVMVGLYAVVNGLATSRWTSRKTKQYALGIDWVWGGGEPRHNRVALELVDQGDPVIVVRRSRKDHYDGSMDGHDVVVFGDETCGWRQTVPLVLAALANIARIVRHFHRLDCSLFWRLIVLPIRQMQLRRFLACYPCRLFWGRDDYNVEHYFRTAEMRRRGGTSIGVAHGILCWGILEPQNRYIDFDLYFMFGTRLYEHHHKEHWSPAMRVVAAGSFGMSREQLAEVSKPRPRDILLFLDPAFDSPEGLAFGIALARAFPDRKVLVKIKANRESAVYYRSMVEMLEREAPTNLHRVERDSYELMLLASYAVSGISTVAAECVQFGLATWALDLADDIKYVYYREFPGFCVSSPDQVIASIRGIEAGTRPYPRDDYAGMVDVSGRIIYDVMRAEVGLAPKQPGVTFQIPQTP